MGNLLAVHEVRFGRVLRPYGFYGRPGEVSRQQYAVLGRAGLLQRHPIWRHALVVEDQVVGGPFSARVLPILPLPAGFLANTLFYATVVWLVTLGPFALRRLIRRSRGLCPKCAYPMGETTACSECGYELA